MKTKMLVMTCVMLAVVAIMSVNVNAFTNSELITYLTNTHTVNGTHYSLSEEQKTAITNYLNANPVDDATAESIKADIEAAEALIASTGAIWKEQLSTDVGAKVVSYMKSAASKAGLRLQVNTSEKTMTLVDSTGRAIAKGSMDAFYRDDNAGSGNALVYTGANTLVYVLPVFAIVAVATLVVIRKRS